MARKAQTQTGARAIKAIFADAERLLAAEQTHEPRDPNQPRDSIRPGQWEGAPFDRLPPGCPVKVIGRDAAGAVYALTATGYMRRVERWDMAALTDLFAPQIDFLLWAWPAYGKKKVIDPETGETEEKLVVARVQKEQAMMCLINEAAKKPTFDPDTQHRGRGGWQDAQNRFVWHSGDFLWTADPRNAGAAKLSCARPAQHEGFLYTRQAATIDPWAMPVTAEESPARRLLAELKTWNWQRPYLDPLLVIGWIATALMGGALKARPIIFTTGGAGVGKSRLQEVVRSALDGVVVTSVNTTAAGIYQRTKRDSLPVMVDELESKPGSTRAEAVIELARVAYSGGDISRGGQDHEASTFTARNAFLFSAIIPPPMMGQDKTRMALLNLGPLDAPGKSGVDITLSPETDSRMLLRQVMDGWADFRNRLLPDYEQALGAQGLSARSIDTYGTLLAAAELLLGPDALEDTGLPIDDATRLGEVIAAATRAERTESLEHWQKCLTMLFQSTVEQWRDGQKPMIGDVLSLWEKPHGLTTEEARQRLHLVNLGLVDAGKAGPNIGNCLAVPLQAQALKRIFADSEFRDGGWFAALKQAPRAVQPGTRKVSINGVKTHCLLIDLGAFAAHGESEG